MNIIVFNIVQGLVCLYAFARGGAPERIVAAFLLIATAATYFVPFEPNRSWHSLRPLILAIDLVLLIGLFWVAARANRFWPMWLGALHLLTICVHIIRAIDPGFLPWMYGGAIGKIAYPMLLVLLVGTWRHRMRKRGCGTDQDWGRTLSS